MATPVSICSNALLKLGSRAISSFTDGTDTATLCANIYPEARNSLLRTSLWNFAMKRVQLAAEAATPAWEYSYQHVLPGDYLRLIQVEDEFEYTIESGRILTNVTPINITYVFRNEDAATYDSLFVELLTQKMVAELAYAVTRSDSKAQAELQKFVAMAKYARSIDSLETPQPQFEDFPLLSTRFGGGY